MVVADFIMSIEDILETKFLNVMTVDLAKSLVSAFGLPSDDESVIETTPQVTPPEPEKTPEPAKTPDTSGGVMSQDAIEAMLNNMGGGTPEPQQPQQQVPPQAQQVPPQTQQVPPQTQQGPYGMIPAQGPYGMMPPYPYMMPSNGMYQMPQQPQQQGTPVEQPQIKEMYQPPAPRMVNVQPIMNQTLNAIADNIGEEQAENLALIMDVPLEVTVEIGRTRRLVKEILGFTKGSLVVLDKLAGEQVDIFVNGQCIAKGDVVVVDDNFGVKITEIIKKPDLQIETKK